MYLEELTEMIEQKIAQNSSKVVFSYYELRLKRNLSQSDLDKVLELITIYLENKNYKVYKTGDTYLYQNQLLEVQTNELLVAIKEDLS